MDICCCCSFWWCPLPLSNSSTVSEAMSDSSNHCLFVTRSTNNTFALIFVLWWLILRRNCARKYFWSASSWTDCFFSVGAWENRQRGFNVEPPEDSMEINSQYPNSYWDYFLGYFSPSFPAYSPHPPLTFHPHLPYYRVSVLVRRKHFQCSLDWLFRWFPQWAREANRPIGREMR
jgi:hypothetical protein